MVITTILHKKFSNEMKRNKIELTHGTLTSFVLNVLATIVGNSFLSFSSCGEVLSLNLYGNS